MLPLHINEGRDTLLMCVDQIALFSHVHSWCKLSAFLNKKNPPQGSSDLGFC